LRNPKALFSCGFFIPRGMSGLPEGGLTMVGLLPIRSAWRHLDDRFSISPLPLQLLQLSPKHVEANREATPNTWWLEGWKLNSVSQLEIARGVTLSSTADTPAVFRVIELIAIPRVVRTRMTGLRWWTPFICCSLLEHSRCLH
jgi:hypothetical protein